MFGSPSLHNALVLNHISSYTDGSNYESTRKTIFITGGGSGIVVVSRSSAQTRKQSHHLCPAQGAISSLVKRICIEQSNSILQTPASIEATAKKLMQSIRI